jgi:hypothetical protein
MPLKTYLISIYLMLVLVSCNYPLQLKVDCGDVQGLIEAIEIANGSPATMDTIILSKACIYELIQVHNNTHGQNGLPAITSPIQIIGNGATIIRSEKAADEFRLFFVSSAGVLNISDLTLAGGIASDPANPQIMANNSGGALFNMGELNIDHSKIIGNRAHGEGGGIANLERLVIKGSSIRDNECYIDGEWAMGGGAGIYNLDKASISMSTIAGNGTQYGWDGIFNGQQAELQIENSTISGNGSTGIDNEGIVGLNFATLAFQPISIVSASGNASVQNSIFADSPCIGNAIHPVGANIDTDGSCDVSYTVPLEGLFLSPLGDYGGPTFTHQLQPNSPAIDAATELPGMTDTIKECPPTDQRGEPRGAGKACDLGAYEFQGDVPAAKSLLGTNTPSITADSAANIDSLTATQTLTRTQEATLTPTTTLTYTAEPRACTLTALVNLFCRPAPGYEAVDSFTSGQSSEILAQSEFLYKVVGANNGLECTVPNDTSLVRVEGNCEGLPNFTLLPAPSAIFTPIPSDTPISTDAPQLSRQAQCSDGIDNDNDGLIDLRDGQCQDASDTDESTP